MKKVAIIGTAPASRMMAPWDDLSWDIWACSPGNHGDNNLKRITVWFELHSIAGLTGPEPKDWVDGYVKWLRAATFPIYMQEHNDLVPNARIFPMPTLVEQHGKNWFTSSIAWMIAFAIYSKVDEIAIFGVDMAADSELYSGQRDGCIRFIEKAEEAGIKVSIPWESCLGHHRPLYGYDQATPFGRRMAVLKAIADGQRARIAADRDRLTLELAFADGAIANMKYVIATWLDGSDAPQHLDLPQELLDEAKAYAEKAIAVKETEAGHVRRMGDHRERTGVPITPAQTQDAIAPFTNVTVPSVFAPNGSGVSLKLTPPPPIAGEQKRRVRLGGKAA